LFSIIITRGTKKNVPGYLPENFAREFILKSRVIISPNAESIRSITTAAFLALLRQNIVLQADPAKSGLFKAF